MTPVGYKRANRRYLAVFVPVMVLYCLALFAGIFITQRLDAPPGWLSPVIAVTIMLPIAGVFFALWRYTRETDEYTRIAQLEALTLAGMTTAFMAGLVGFLQIFDVIANFPVFWLLPVFFLSFGLAKCLNRMPGGGR